MTRLNTPPLTSDDARALFDAALDGELDAEQQLALDQALAQDEPLRADYERHRAMLRATAELGLGAPIDLLSGVQHKLRARSGGKFYRDRFSERRSGGKGLSWLILLSACLIALVLLWFAFDAGLLARDR